MPIRPSIGAATRVSDDLSELIENLVNDPDREPPETLGDVREALRERAPADEMEYLHPDERESLLAEIDEVIEEFGEDAAVGDFIEAEAGEALSRVIEAAMSDPALAEEPTLGAVREALLHGIAERLAGEGVLDEEDQNRLFGEIEELIRRYGDDAPAEDFIRLD